MKTTGHYILNVAPINFKHEREVICACCDFFFSDQRLCFHFAKAISTKRGELDLRGLCNSNTSVNEWLRRVRHLPFMPDNLRLEFAADLIAARPTLAPLDAARLQQFANYVEVVKPSSEGRLGAVWGTGSPDH